MYEKKEQPVRVLIAESEPNVRETIASVLQDEGFSVESSDTDPAGLKKIAMGSYEVVISGLDFLDLSGMEVLDRIKRESPESEVILIDGQWGREKVIEAIRKEAFDCLSRPVDPTRLLITVEHAAEKIQLKRAMKSYAEQVGELAVIDGLTGLYNHQYLVERIESEIKRVRRFGWPLSCLMIDIDHFSRINSEYGHQAGDAVLRQIAEVLDGTIREIDVIGRYGGEVFMIILPNTPIEETAGLANRILTLVENYPFSVNGHSLRLTVSIGGSSYFYEKFMSGEDVIRWADRALLRSKRSGRNTISLFKGSDDEVIEGLMQKSFKEIDDVKERLEVSMDGMRRSFLEQIRSIVTEVEKDLGYKAPHAPAVTDSAVELARALGLSEGMIEKIRYAAMLHDIGMVGMDRETLGKSGLLMDTEYSMIREHSAIASYIARSIKFLEEEIVIIRHHHEAYDGSGYPDGLKAEDIPIASRVLAVADAYDAMTSDLPFGSAHSREKALEAIADGAGTQFDPMIASTFIAMKKEESRNR